ncbi:hypothetical protein CPB86DRAFT_790942 [Serendipita vermifera]|nr:hypothetical protein CPB86DRAFT_790942 [Serendipita vermifera]
MERTLTLGDSNRSNSPSCTGYPYTSILDELMLTFLLLLINSLGSRNKSMMVVSQ